MDYKELTDKKKRLSEDIQILIDRFNKDIDDKGLVLSIYYSQEEDSSPCMGGSYIDSKLTVDIIL